MNMDASFSDGPQFEEEMASKPEATENEYTIEASEPEKSDEATGWGWGL